MSGFMKSLRTSADRAAFEAARLMRIQREQFKVKAQEEQKRELLLNLGEAVWQMYSHSQINDPHLVGICQQVQTTIQQIQATEKAIEQIKQEHPPEPPQCPGCGQELSTDNAFCPTCGAKITATTPPSATVTQLTPPSVAATAPQPAATQACPHCGRALRTGAPFCSGCGHQVGTP